MKILVLNCGSSSLKFQLINMDNNERMAKGNFERIGGMKTTLKLNVRGNKEELLHIARDYDEAISFVLEVLLKPEYDLIKSLDEIGAVGHRIVHGGEMFSQSVLIDDEVIEEIEKCIDLAPLHNPAGVAGIKAAKNALPNIPMVAVFDTAFHESLDPVHYLYSVPYDWYEKYRARKYGAHGTSVRYVANRTAKLLNKDLKDLKLVVCHLGSGASITAVKDGKSYDTSMGFTPLAGITMGTRSGDVDPSLLQFVMHKKDISIDEMIDILNHDSGLLGISGVSPDMRDLKHNPDKRAQLAREIFINRIIRYVGAYITEMGGADAIVFTAGIGEHDARVRAAVMKAFEFMGLVPDLEANKVNGEKTITKPESKIRAMIVPTNEELMIERDVVRLAHLD